MPPNKNQMISNGFLSSTFLNMLSASQNVLVWSCFAQTLPGHGQNIFPPPQGEDSETKTPLDCWESDVVTLPLVTSEGADAQAKTQLTLEVRWKKMEKES